jgi:hypothetical protein
MNKLIHMVFVPGIAWSTLVWAAASGPLAMARGAGIAGVLTGLGVPQLVARCVFARTLSRFETRSDGSSQPHPLDGSTPSHPLSALRAPPSGPRPLPRPNPPRRRHIISSTDTSDNALRSPRSAAVPQCQATHSRTVCS